MPRRATPLSAAKVRTAGPGQYVDGNGLRLVVKDTGARAWVFRFTIAGRTREMGLGRAGSEPGAVPLADARQQAGELYRAVRTGRDVLAERDASRSVAREEERRASSRALTFRDVAERYIAAHRQSWKNSTHRAQWSSTLIAYAYPHLGAVPFADIRTDHVRAALELIWDAKPETAGRVRGRIETILDYGRAAGWREGENPARWKGHLDQLFPRRSKVRAVEHHAALPWREIDSFMGQLRDMPGLGALALRWTILTAARTGETLGARWCEIDRDSAVWTVPAARMKAAREHRVPLSAEALSVLDIVAPLGSGDTTALIFPGQGVSRPLSNMSMSAVLRRAGRVSATVHGFRSTFRDWAAEATSTPRELAEAALAHTVSNKVEAAYRRGDLFEKRRQLMTEWARFVSAA